MPSTPTSAVSIWYVAALYNDSPQLSYLPTLPRSYNACKAGADVYVQKPIRYDVVEGQAMVAAARKYKRTVQVGLERRSTPHILEARDRYIKSGKLGKIAEAGRRGGAANLATVRLPATVS